MGTKSKLDSLLDTTCVQSVRLPRCLISYAHEVCQRTSKFSCRQFSSCQRSLRRDTAKMPPLPRLGVYSQQASSGSYGLDFSFQQGVIQNRTQEAFWGWKSRLGWCREDDELRWRSVTLGRSARSHVSRMQTYLLETPIAYMLAQECMWSGRHVHCEEKPGAWLACTVVFAAFVKSQSSARMYIGRGVKNDIYPHMVRSAINRIS